jgi:ribosomal protein S18 acetylase RimI-like enzyme
VAESALTAPVGWRPMAEADLAAVMAIADAVHPRYPERREVFAEKLRLFPAGCFICVQDDAILGYAMSHPWRVLCPAPLDTLLDALPETPETLWIHDVALRPQTRGRGLASAVARHLLAVARDAGLATASLVAVPGAVAFWGARGFSPVLPASLPSKALAWLIDVYGEDAAFMTAPASAGDA